MKTFLTKILPILVPILLYLSWLYFARRKAAASGGAPPRLREAPWTILVAAGLGVLIMGLIALGLFAGEEPGGVYVPPHLEDGKVVPGRIER